MVVVGLARDRGRRAGPWCRAGVGRRCWRRRRSTQRTSFLGVGTEAVRVDLDAWTHRRSDGDLLQVATLGCGRLGALQLVEHRPEVLLGAAGSKLALPIVTCTLPYRSVRYSTLPPLNSATARATLGVTVPVFGFGIRPRGPSTRPSRPTRGIMSGVAIASRSSSMSPSSNVFGEIVGTDDVGAGVAGFLPLPRRSRTRRPEWSCPCPRAGASRAADHLIGLARIDPRRMAARRLRRIPPSPGSWPASLPRRA